MAKGVELSLIIFIAVIGLAVAPAVLAESGDAAQAREKPQAIAVAKERAPEKQSAAQEKVQAKKDAVKARAQDKKETLKTVAEERKEKREALRAKVADSDSGKVEALGRVRLKEVAELAPEEARARLAKLRVVKADEDFKVRPLPAAAIESRKQAFERLKEVEKRIKEENKERLDRLKDAKERLRACGNETASDECRRAQTNAVEQAKEAALKTADRLINHLSKLKEKILGSENMAEDKAASSALRIDAAIAEVEAIKQKIISAVTKDEFNKAARELKQLVSKAKRTSESHSQSFLRAEINGVIHRAEVSERKLDCALAGLEANGADTSAVDAKIAEFSSKLGAAKEKLKTAKELLGAEEEANIEEGKKLIREARDIVIEAHRLLEEIRRDLRKLGAGPCKEEQEIVVGEEEEK